MILSAAPDMLGAITEMSTDRVEIMHVSFIDIDSYL
jgi:hypothetical protein